MFEDRGLQREFDQKGYVVVDLLEAGTIERLRALWGEGEPVLNRLPFSATIMSPDGAYRRRTHGQIHAEVAAALAAFMPAYDLVYCMFNAKQARGPSSVVGLHLDWTLVDEARFGSVGIFCPLVDVDERNGCLFAVDGSQHVYRGPRSMYQVLPHAPLERVFLEHARLLPMRAGQACIHALTLYHGSVPNVSDALRLSLGLLAIERGAALRHYREQGPGAPFEELEVDREFLFDLVYGAPPRGGRRLGEAPSGPPALTEEELRALLGTVSAPALGA